MADFRTPAIHLQRNRHQPGAVRNRHHGKPLNDPIPDTVLNATSGVLQSAPATGTPALLDKFTITKPDLRASLAAQLSAPATVEGGAQLVYSISVTNHSSFALNGTQVRLILPDTLSYDGGTSRASISKWTRAMRIGWLKENRLFRRICG